MLTLTNDEHIANLLEYGLMPSECVQYLAAEYETLKGSLHFEEAQPFSLEEHGYRMVIVQYEDECQMSTDPDNLVLLEFLPEYVEIVRLSDRVSMYRACLMPGNECFVLVYALVGSLRPNMEQWFAVQAGCLAGRTYNE